MDYPYEVLRCKSREVTLWQLLMPWKPGVPLGSYMRLVSQYLQDYTLYL